MNNRILVVKCGGNAAVDPAKVCEDIAALHHEGQRVVLVHGGSADIDALGRRLGVTPRRLVAPDGVSARHTDADTLQVVATALSGIVQPRLVTSLVKLDVRAVGLSGWDGGLLRAKRKKAHRAVVDGRQVVVRDDHSGRITHVDAELLRTLLDAGIVPVVSSPALAEDGGAVNVDADRTAAAVAGALGADTLLMLTGAPGVLSDPDDETSVHDTYRMARTGAPEHVGGGMGLKLVAAREALFGGVPRVLIGDGRRAQPVRTALGGTATTVRLADGEAPLEGSERSERSATSGRSQSELSAPSAMSQSELSAPSELSAQSEQSAPSEQATQPEQSEQSAYATQQNGRAAA
ncbi:[LysW]-aminoadipate kinase [Streptomyces sp. NPDC058475]|uniref:[LysW]-aminoadipate kinase n=1 Tax=Streptomyces sp. NPDC058475 TaxID=3346518 RepID=UPI003665849D